MLDDRPAVPSLPEARATLRIEARGMLLNGAATADLARLDRHYTGLGILAELDATEDEAQAFAAVVSADAEYRAQPGPRV